MLKTNHKAKCIRVFSIYISEEAKMLGNNFFYLKHTYWTRVKPQNSRQRQNITMPKANSCDKRTDS